MELLQEILDKSLWLFAEAHGDIIKDEKVYKSLEEGQKEFQRLIALLNQKGDHVIAFLGKTNVGKSTLMNALLGEKVAPVYNGDWSARPVEYRYAKIPKLLLGVPGKNLPEEIPFQSAEELKKILEKYSTMSNPEDAIGQEQIVVKLDAPILQSGLIFCDMPGFLACTGEDNMDSKGTHQQDIQTYLEQQQKNIHAFLVTNATIPDESVIRHFKENLEKTLEDKLFHIIVNYRTSDNIEERKKDLEKAWTMALQRVLHFSYINAKHTNDDNPAERDKLMEDIQAYVTPYGQQTIAWETLQRFFENLWNYLRDFKKCSNPSCIFPRTALGVVNGLVQKSDNQRLKAIFNQYWCKK